MWDQTEAGDSFIALSHNIWERMYTPCGDQSLRLHGWRETEHEIKVHVWMLAFKYDPGGGGGGYSDVVWTGVRGWSLQTHTHL